MNQSLVKATVLVIAVFLMVGFGAAFAQQAEESPQQQTAVKTIFDYKAELNLTDDQVKKIREQLTALDKEVRVLRAKLIIANVDLQDLMEKEGDINEIKKKVKEAFDIQASIRIADIEASRKINGVLKTEQLKKWREIQAEAASKR
jgi:septal ring factor EnvC (AmiA/AmiB activator)